MDDPLDIRWKLFLFPRLASPAKGSAEVSARANQRALHGSKL